MSLKSVDVGQLDGTPILTVAGMYSQPRHQDPKSRGRLYPRHQTSLFRVSQDGQRSSGGYVGILRGKAGSLDMSQRRRTSG